METKKKTTEPVRCRCGERLVPLLPLEPTHLLAPGESLHTSGLCVVPQK